MFLSTVRVMVKSIWALESVPEIGDYTPMMALVGD